MSSTHTQPEALFRQKITGKARLAGVLGWPVSHSRSPLLHNYWLARYGIDGAYVPLPVKPDQFAQAVYGLQAAGFRGANVTIPHKEAAYAIATELDHTAKRAGAVNTLIFEANGVIRGLSTDGDGFIASMESAGCKPKGKALLLGAGGAARSVAAALQDRGLHVAVTNRTQSRAQALVEALPGLECVPWAEWEERLGDYTVLVNTTSLGMEGGPDPLFRPSLHHAAAHLVVADIVYVPRITPLLAEAKHKGLKTVGGLGMLLHQARLGFREWFGQDPEVDADLEAYVRASL